MPEQTVLYFRPGVFWSWVPVVAGVSLVLAILQMVLPFSEFVVSVYGFMGMAYLLSTKRFRFDHEVGGLHLFVALFFFFFFWPILHFGVAE